MNKIENFKNRLSDENFKKKTIRMGGNMAYKIFRTVLLFAMCFIIIHPVLYMISVAFRESRDLYDPTVIWVPKNFTSENLKMVIEVLDYWKLMANTIFYAGVSTILSVISCALAGYGFARFKFKLKGIFFVLLIFMIIVPPQLVSIPLYLQYSDFNFFGVGALIKSLTGAEATVNLLNTPLTLFIPAALGTGLRSGILIYMFQQFFRGMPVALEDAAYIDGCGVATTFIRIIMPNASGSFLVAALLSFVWYYNDYFFSSMYFSEAPTVSVALAGLKSMLGALSGGNVVADPYAIIAQLQAGCLVTIIPLVIVFLFLQKKFIKSVTTSGIVG